MSEYGLVFHADTALDYDDAYYWYEEQQNGLGEKFIAAVNALIQKILNNPETYSVKSRPGYHEARVNNFPYSVVYRIYRRQKFIFITSIHHHKKHPRKKYRK